MRPITISKHSETYIHIDCERSISYELRDRFSFFAANYRHHPKFKKRMWDGKIYLFNSRTGLIYKGLFNEVIEFFDEMGYEYHLNYSPKILDLSFDEAKSIFQGLDGPFEPYDHQIEAFRIALAEKNCILESATSSGKSYLIYALARVLTAKGLKGLVLVPTVNLVSQLYKDFIDYSIRNGWNVNDNVHFIFQGQDKFVDAPCTISTWQSLFKLDPSFFEKYDFVIADECHLFKATSLKTIVESCVNTKYRIGCTGTLDGEQINELTLTGLFGPSHDVIDTNELIKGGMATPLRINLMILGYEKNDEVVSKDWPGQTDFFTDHDKRNRFIRKLIANEKGNKLVLFQHVKKHGMPLYNAMKAEYPDREIHFIAGGIKQEKREEIRQRLSKTDNAILIASYGTYSTGMNVPSIKHVFSLFPGKSTVRIMQSIGRALRLADGKTEAIFWDFADRMKGRNQKTKKTCYNMGYAHLEKRVELYVKRRFNIRFYEVNLE